MNSTTKPALSLVVASGPHEGRAIPLVLPFVIGRAAGCHLRPASALVSHEHCVIENRDGRAVIRDLDSTNGTFLNDDLLLADCPLNDGDEVRVGPLRFIVRIEGAPQRRSGGDTVVAVRAEGETVTDRDHMTEDEAARLLSADDESAGEATEEHPPVE
jgi:pSer/pThr/pTyr-binding forkhead associated (FHA) protein